MTTVEHAGGNGHGGKVVLTMNWAYAVDGTKVDLASTSQDGGSGDKKGSASTATIASYALLGPIGLFAHNFVHGKDVTIGTDKVFVLYTDHNIDIRPGHAIAPQIPVPVASPTAS